MKLFKFSLSRKALSLVEVLIVIFIISTSILLTIRVFPAIFMLNKKTDDMIAAKNLTDDLFQTLKGEINTPELNAGNTNLYYWDTGSNIPANNLVNSNKCFWRLVRLTSDPNFSNYGGLVNNCLDTLIDSSVNGNLNADNKYFNTINPSINDPQDTNKPWVASKQFWVNWRKSIETQIYPGSPLSRERASGIVTARYIYINPGDNTLKDVLSDEFSNNFETLRGHIEHVGGPSLLTSKYMLEVTVALYWKNRLAKDFYTRDVNKPNYRISTLIPPKFSTAVKQQTTPTAVPTPTP